MMQKFRINPNGAFSYFIFFVLAFTTLSSMLTSNTLHIERIDYLENNIPDIHSDYGVNNIPLLIMSPFILGVVAFFRPNKPIRTICNVLDVNMDDNVVNANTKKIKYEKAPLGFILNFCIIC